MKVSINHFETVKTVRKTKAAVMIVAGRFLEYHKVVQNVAIVAMPAMDIQTPLGVMLREFSIQLIYSNSNL